MFTLDYLDVYCSCKVLLAFLESSVSEVKDLAEPELQPLMDRGVLKAPEMRIGWLKKEVEAFLQHQVCEC